jgi:fatty acid desaturase
MRDFLLFRRMVTPYIIMVIFWLAIVLLVIGLVATSVAAFAGDSSNNSPFLLCVIWPIGLPLGVLVIRIYCELLILFFRMNETLTEIKNNLQKQ